METIGVEADGYDPSLRRCKCPGARAEGRGCSLLVIFRPHSFWGLLRMEEEFNLETHRFAFWVFKRLHKNPSPVGAGEET